MKNQNGFTVIEFLTSFVLVAVVASLFFEITMSLKNLYTNAVAQTELTTKQSILSKNINEKLLTSTINQIISCGTSCLEFHYSDTTIDILSVDKINKLITFGDYVLELPIDSEIGDVKMDIIYNVLEQPYSNDTILNIKIPVTYKTFADKDFGVNVVYQFNRHDIVVSI